MESQYSVIISPTDVILQIFIFFVIFWRINSLSDGLDIFSVYIYKQHVISKIDRILIWDLRKFELEIATDSIIVSAIGGLWNINELF